MFTLNLFAIILISLFGTILSLDPTEQDAICKLAGTETLIDCIDPCSTTDIITCQPDNTSIVTIELGNKKNISGTIPLEYGYFSLLRNLNLQHNDLSGTIPTHLGNLTSLVVLFLEMNKLTGTIPTQLGNISTLQVLNLYANNLSGPILELGNITNILHLHLGSNNLTGTIPKELGNYTSLNFLYLDNNKLTGTIPTQLGKLKNLSYLYLCNNQLMGEIPIQLGNLTSLEVLDLSNTDRTGTIPTQLGKITKLTYLYLNNNNLTGTIPKEIGNISTLVRCQMENNNLTGTIPTQLGMLIKLSYLDLSNNQLTGTVPTQIMSLVINNNLILYLSNNLLDLNQPQPNNPQPDISNISLEVDQTLNLSDGNFIFETVNFSPGSNLSTENANLTTTRIRLSENSVLSIANSTVFVQENITVPTGFTLIITNPTTTSLEASNSINIQSNTTLNIILPPNFTLTSDLTLISFKNITGTFTNINTNNECFEVAANNIAFILTQNKKCISSSTQETITISVITIFFISLLI